MYLLQDYGDYIDFCVLKTIPECERLGVNAALVNAILEENRNRFGNGFYICDGSRSVFHETAFQDYLEKYFEFRKAYCVLKIHYRFPLNLAIKVLFPFRNYIKGNSKIVGQIKGVLKMEESKRNCANMTYR